MIDFVPDFPGKLRIRKQPNVWMFIEATHVFYSEEYMQGQWHQSANTWVDRRDALRQAVGQGVPDFPTDLPEEELERILNWINAERYLQSSRHDEAARIYGPVARPWNGPIVLDPEDKLPELGEDVASQRRAQEAAEGILLGAYTADGRLITRFKYNFTGGISPNWFKIDPV